MVYLATVSICDTLQTHFSAPLCDSFSKRAGGGDAVRPVGTVYLGAARGDKAYVKKLFVSRPDRALIRARAAQTALEMALRLAQGKTPAGTQVLAESAQHDPAALTALDETLRAE